MSPTEETTQESTGEPLPVGKLALKREVVGELTDELLTTQGHSLWTCDETMHEDADDGPGPRPARHAP
ncbi:hypothetical protein ACFWIA_02655 [Streptomyces sp. NPDC127068]|uniref:hypothetical protein n=1 Tax=Streptomyces sp. NPDC127068 TaxID=3347127 RepID=UPI003649BF7B